MKPSLVRRNHTSPGIVTTLLILFWFISFKSNAQCSSTSANSAVSFVDDNSIGVLNFSSEGNAAASDNNRATASALITLLNGNTHYLKATGFNFAIPSTAVICGIVAEVEKSASNISLLATVTDNNVRLVKGGAVTGNNYATATEWPATESYYSYGGANDLWGTSWTPAEINAGNFGLAFSAHIIGLITLLPSARIDHIRMTVYYNLVLPIRLVAFSAKTTDDGQSTLLQWTTGNNDEEAVFTVQRSSDGKNWYDLANVAGIIQNGDQIYRYRDSYNKEFISFYRLQIRQQNAAIMYSTIAEVWRPGARQFSLFPNPASDQLFIQYKGTLTNIGCINSFGQAIRIRFERSGDDLFVADIEELPRGIYILKANGNFARFIKR